MKSFARLFFLIGALLGVFLVLNPDSLKIVSIPFDDSMLPAAMSPDRITSPPQAMRTTTEKVELVVNGVPYLFQLASTEEAHILQEAKAFCSANSEAWSLFGDALERGCTQPVFSNLLIKVKEAKESKEAPVSEHVSSDEQASITSSTPTSTIYQVNVPVTNGKTYAISFDAAVHDPFEVSEHFCRENYIALNLLSESQIVQGCIPSVGKYIVEQLNSVGFFRTTVEGEVA